MVGTIIWNTLCIIGSILCIKDNYNIFKYTKENKSSVGNKSKDFMFISWLNIVMWITLTINFIIKLF